MNCTNCDKLHERVRLLEMKLSLRESEIEGLQQSAEYWRQEFILNLKAELGVIERLPLTRAVSHDTISEERIKED